MLIEKNNIQRFHNLNWVQWDPEKPTFNNSQLFSFEPFPHRVNLTLRYHPGGRSELVAAAPQQAGVSESYQHNYPLVKVQDRILYISIIYAS